MTPKIPKDFDPPITHPGYLIRQGILQGVARHSSQLKGKLMDFGCGSKPYKSLFNVDEYIGVDFDSPGHPHVNENIDVFYDGITLPFPDAHFDSIFTSEVFEHIFNLDEILKELSRVIKPGGKILITCPFAICEHEVPNDFARYSSFAMKFLLGQHGFNVIAADKSGNAVQAIWQLRITYWHQHILPKFRRIPVLRLALRTFVYVTFNLAALGWSKILPNRVDLYLNNILLAEKLQTGS